MRITHELKAWRRERRPICLAAGFFDGVHRGHARVIGRAVAQARACGGAAWVLTFDPHPARVLDPAAAPRLLTCLPHKLRLLAGLGVDGCMVLPFTADLAARSPEDFLEHLLGHAPTLAAMFVGAGWRFGRGRSGTPELLQHYAARHGFRVTALPPVVSAGAPVSSTRIRAAVHQGELALAERLLGRPFSLLGRVTSGQRLGRRLGYPTANITPFNEVRPPHGIYAAWARVGHTLHTGVVSYGVRPTLPREHTPQSLLELHLFDFRGNLYGRELEVGFARKLRDEAAFPSLEALRAGIARDCTAARRVLASPGAKNRFTRFAQAYYSPPQAKQRSGSNNTGRTPR